MSMINVTPSSGRREAVHFDLNRMRVKPGERVVYWSEWASAPRVETIDAYWDKSGNWYTIDGEKIFVTYIWARVPDGRDHDAIVAAYAAIGRRELAINEVLALAKQLGLKS